MNPTLYQINTRIWLGELGKRLGHPATLDDIDDAALDRLAAMGWDWVWMLGLWQTGARGRAVSLAHEGMRREYAELLSDFQDADVCGSPFAIFSYQPHEHFGSLEALDRFRARLHARGMRLLLDFVPNHTALDRAEVFTHPQWFVQGSEDDLAREPHNYVRLATSGGERIFAHGRDPYFAGWTDTLQLDYRQDFVQRAMIEELATIAGWCDGVRCDMAMLLLTKVFARTWPSAATAEQSLLDFWPAAIAEVRRRHPEFVLIAEVYWDLEWELQQVGFDFTYDKRLYDRLHALDARAVRGHLMADLDFQRRSVRFLENHDEPRAAAVFPPGIHQAAAVVAMLVPGMRFFHEGQLEGRRIRTSIHLSRRTPEPVDPDLQTFYARLLEVLKQDAVRRGQWQLLDCRPAWDGNGTWENFIAFQWQNADGERRLVAVNYSAGQGQCYVTLSPSDARGKTLRLRDLMGDAVYDRSADELAEKGLYLDMPAWGYHVFEVTSFEA